MSFTLTSILPDFFWRKTNHAHNPVGGIAPPPWDAHLKLSFMDEAGIDVAVTSIPTPGVHVGDDGRSSIVARDSFATRNFTVQRAFMVVAVIASSIAILFAPALAQSQDRSVMTTDALGANARQAMIDIFRKKDPTAVDRYFAESFIQHDPNLADGRAGMKSFVEEVASSSAADITIYRTLVDGALVLLHSRYQGVSHHGQNAIAFDLFRFSGGKIAEHWGGQEPEAPPNASGRTQVGGLTDIVDREKTEANRTLVRAYRETVMVALRSDRIEEFVSAALAQHASKIGDGIAQLRSRIASVAKEGGQLHLTPRRYVAEGNFVLVLTEGDLPSGPTALYDLVRVENGKIVEHWDVLTPIPPRDQWKNANGPF